MTKITDEKINIEECKSVDVVGEWKEIEAKGNWSCPKCGQHLAVSVFSSTSSMLPPAGPVGLGFCMDCKKTWGLFVKVGDDWEIDIATLEGGPKVKHVKVAECE